MGRCEMKLKGRHYATFTHLVARFIIQALHTELLLYWHEQLDQDDS